MIFPFSPLRLAIFGAVAMTSNNSRNQAIRWIQDPLAITESLDDFAKLVKPYIHRDAMQQNADARLLYVPNADSATTLFTKCHAIKNSLESYNSLGGSLRFPSDSFWPTQLEKLCIALQMVAVRPERKVELDSWGAFIYRLNLIIPGEADWLRKHQWSSDAYQDVTEDVSPSTTIATPTEPLTTIEEIDNTAIEALMESWKSPKDPRSKGNDNEKKNSKYPLGIQYDRKHKVLSRDGVSYKSIEQNLTQREHEVFLVILDSKDCSCNSEAFAAGFLGTGSDRSEAKRKLNEKLSVLDLRIPDVRATKTYRIEEVPQKPRRS